MTETKECTNCSVEKPLTKFYKRKHSDSYNSWCKACMKEASRKQRRLPKRKSYVESEQIAIEHLQSLGIPTTTGKASPFGNFVDLVCYGCVRIEVKDTWAFSRKQQVEGVKGELILLMRYVNDPRKREIEYYLFPSNHPVFYHPDGRMKTAIEVATGDSNRGRYNEGYTHLTRELMAEYRDRWDLIEMELQKYKSCLIEQGHKQPNSKAS